MMLLILHKILEAPMYRYLPCRLLEALMNPISGEVIKSLAIIAAQIVSVNHSHSMAELQQLLLVQSCPFLPGQPLEITGVVLLPFLCQPMGAPYHTSDSSLS